MMTSRICLDDRGNRVRVPSPLEDRDRLAETPRGKSLLYAREDLFATPIWSAYRWPVAIAVTVFVWCAFLAFEWILNFNDAPIGRFLVRFPVSVFWGFAVFMTLPKSYPRVAAVSKDLSEARVCVVCRSDLAWVAAQDDNCVVCPRCGSATRFRPVDPLSAIEPATI